MTAAAPPSPTDSGPGRVQWGGALLLGVLATVGVFLFLGSLQPPVSDSERIELPAMIKFDLGLAKAKKPPPPPAKERPKKTEPRKRRKRPEKQKKRVQRKVATRRPRRVQTTAAPRMRADIAMGLQGIALAAAGTGAGGGLSLEIPTGVQEFAAEAMDMLDYEDRRRRVRDMQSARQRRRNVASMAGGAASGARLVRRYKPSYPQVARARGIEGYVVVDVLIGVDGRIEEFEIVDADPGGVFETEIQAALPRWQFAPAKDESGRPIEERQTFRYEFKLEDD